MRAREIAALALAMAACGGVVKAAGAGDAGDASSGGESSSSTSGTSGSGSAGGTSSSASSTSGSASSSASGSGTSASSSSGSSGTSGSGSCTINPQFAAATCAACAQCVSQYCCRQIDACYADPGCNQMLACVLNCYNGVAPDGGLVPEGGTDQCAAYCQLMNVGAVSVKLYAAQDYCENTGVAGTVCNGSAPTAPCNCN